MINWFCKLVQLQLPPIEGVEIVKGNREFKGFFENVQFVKLYQNAEEVIENLKTR